MKPARDTKTVQMQARIAVLRADLVSIHDDIERLAMLQRITEGFCTGCGRVLDIRAVNGRITYIACHCGRDE